MGQQFSFHAPQGADFLGYRKTRDGGCEIVYDNGRQGRMVWRVEQANPDEMDLSQALQVAVGSGRVVASLHLELKKRAIAIERIAG